MNENATVTAGAEQEYYVLLLLGTNVSASSSQRLGSPKLSAPMPRQALSLNRIPTLPACWYRRLANCAFYFSSYNSIGQPCFVMARRLERDEEEREHHQASPLPLMA